MKPKTQEKRIAVKLRQKGHTYNEIAHELRIAKSTLSVWLRERSFTQEEENILETRISNAIAVGRIRAGVSLRRNRINREKEIDTKATEEFVNISPGKKNFFMIGIALYWAEGSKGGNSFEFTNADPAMIRYMLRWIFLFLNVTEKEVSARLYAHASYMNENPESFWVRVTGLPKENFKKTIYKKTRFVSKKRAGYKGCLRINIYKKELLLKMLVWKRLLAKEPFAR